jgi:hypothetical protein
MVDTSWIGEVLGQYGLPGVFLFALGWAVRTLYERNVTLSDKLASLSEHAIKTDLDVANDLRQLSELVKARTP